MQITDVGGIMVRIDREPHALHKPFYVIYTMRRTKSPNGHAHIIKTRYKTEAHDPPYLLDPGYTESIETALDYHDKMVGVLEIDLTSWYKKHGVTKQVKANVIFTKIPVEFERFKLDQL